MKAMELKNLKSGDYVQSVKTGEVLEVVGMDAEAGKYILSNSKLYAASTIKRWYSLVQVEPQVEDNTGTEEPAAVESFNIRQKEQEDTATTEELELDEDLEVILAQLGCTATKRKEYLGIYKERYRGCVAMLRTSKEGNLHIDMKEKIYKALDEEVREQIEADYHTGIYDKTRGYFRIKDCDNLRVLAVVLKTALQLAELIG